MIILFLLSQQLCSIGINTRLRHRFVENAIQLPHLFHTQLYEDEMSSPEIDQ